MLAPLNKSPACLGRDNGGRPRGPAALPHLRVGASPEDPPCMFPNRRIHLTAAGLTLVLHVALLLAGLGAWDASDRLLQAQPQTVVQQLLLPDRAVPPEPFEAPPPPPARAVTLTPLASTAPIAIDAPRMPASMPAPSAPTAEEWAFAARYTLKNSKGYRHSWGQQVRSMMGTAVEGPDQGVVRFRVEIAADGTLARLQTLWSTSERAEQLARQAVEAMPPLPPTPTGQPLVFERTIAFTPYAVDGPPSYQNDCKPDPPVFRNPFVWDGRSPAVRQAPEARQTLDPQALEDCLRQLPQDSVEAQMARDQRLMERWRWK